MQKHSEIHERSAQAAALFKRGEADLISSFQELDETKAFLEKERSSLFDYSVSELGLSPDVTSNLITVARKAKNIPALQDAIQNGEITVSKARKITSVIKPENQEEWVAQAKTLSVRKLEEAVAKENPKEAVKERVKPVSENRLELRMGISKELEIEFKRVQDLESQRTSRAVNLEETLQALVTFYLEAKDPVKKAERSLIKKVVSHVTPEFSDSTQPIPTQVRHQVNLRDGGQCAHYDSKGIRCGNKRWLDCHVRPHQT